MKNNRFKLALLGPIDISTFKKNLKNKIDNKLVSLGTGNPVNVIAQGLIKKKINLTILSISNKTKKTFLFKGKNLKIYIIPKNKNFFEKIISYFFYYNIFELLRVRKILLKEKINLIHTHFWDEHSLSAKLSNIPYIITGHDRAKSLYKYYNNPLTLLRLFFKFLPLKTILKSSKFICVVSNSIKKILKANKLTKKKIILINNSSNFSKIIKKTNNYRLNIVTIMNGFIEFKNPHLCMKIFNNLLKKAPYSKLFMFGKGFEKNGIAYNFAKQNKLNRKIYFKGPISHKKFKQFLIRKADLLLNFSFEETHSYSCLDAFSSKVPVLINKNCEGLFETIHKGKFGFYCNSLNEEQISNKIRKLIKNKRLINKKTNDVFKYGIYKLNNDIIINKYINLYNKCLG